jgi:hypothetical protein
MCLTMYSLNTKRTNIFNAESFVHHLHMRQDLSVRVVNVSVTIIFRSGGGGAFDNVMKLFLSSRLLSFAMTHAERFQGCTSFLKISFDMISLSNVVNHPLYVALALFMDEGGRCRKSERVFVAPRNTTLFTDSN